MLGETTIEQSAAYLRNSSGLWPGILGKWMEPEAVYAPSEPVDDSLAQENMGIPSLLRLFPQLGDSVVRSASSRWADLEENY